jgi:hypothetical protein
MKIEINFVRKKSRTLLRMTGALQRSSREKFGSSPLVGREIAKIVSRVQVRATKHLALFRSL